LSPARKEKKRRCGMWVVGEKKEKKKEKGKKEEEGNGNRGRERKKIEKSSYFGSCEKNKYIKNGIVKLK
jgi:hypothetical protein